MPDVKVVEIDAMEGFYGGLARRARAELGVSAWGMQVMTLEPGQESYAHAHDESNPEAGQEEVYVPLAGSAELVAGEERFALRPGVMARIGPEQERRTVAGPDGFRFLAIGGVPGEAYSPLPWTELGEVPPAVPGD
jgi:quercetin dioxygenase-like cupin family protein